MHRHDPISLLDLNQTILELANATLPNACGQSLFTKHHIVKVEVMLTKEDQPILLEAVIQDDVKLLRLDDEIKCRNLNDEDIVLDEDRFASLKQYLLSDAEKQQCLAFEVKQRQDHELLKAWGSRKQPVEKQRFINPKSARSSANE